MKRDPPPRFLERGQFLGSRRKGLGKGVVVYSTTDVKECVAYTSVVCCVFLF